MTNPGITAIRIVKGNTVFHVHGEDVGSEGVWLAKGQVQGLYDAPVQTTWKAGAYQIGSSQRSRKFLHRDLVLGFHIKDTTDAWEFNDSQFRRMFDYQEDPWDPGWQPTTIEVETELSGVRKLDVLLSEAPDFDSALDPQMQQHGNVLFKLRAGKPFWYQADATSTFTGNGVTGSGTVSVSNPTDQVAYHKWVVTPATWTLPDRKWTGAPNALATTGSRNVSGIAITNANAGAVIDLDRSEVMFRDSAGTNLLGQLAGKFFEYPIPPYTPTTSLPVSYTNAPNTGASVQVRVPRNWSRPWGLEFNAGS